MATSIKIDDTLKLRVQRLANVRRRSPHWIMREAIAQEAIAQYVEREEARESFKQEALASDATSIILPEPTKPANATAVVAGRPDVRREILALHAQPKELVDPGPSEPDKPA